jgi:acyl-coenzyme A synthetase/AMP-(fatty) acid ligase
MSSGRLIVSTGGTTGMAKQVILDSARLALMADAKAYPDGEVYGLDRPGQIAAMSQSIYVLLNGKTLMVKPTHEGLAGWVRRTRIDTFCTDGPGFRYIMSFDGEWPHLKRVDVGGQVITDLDFDLYRARLPDDCTFSNRYAATEAGGVISRQYFTKDSRIEKNSRLPVGKALPGVEIEILHRSGRSGGEIIVKTPWMALGYHGNPELTAEKFKDGWYHTGDLGWWDDDGNLHHEGRML